eukprot:8336332-Pyramimonas_sp.AAC.1
MAVAYREDLLDSASDTKKLEGVDPNVIDLAQKELMSIHANMNRMGTNAMKAYLWRKGAQPW